MAKMLVRFCDKCKKEIPVYDDKLQDTIDREYVGKDICPNCDLDIKLVQSLAKSDLINNVEPGTALKKMLQMYGVEVE